MYFFCESSLKHDVLIRMVDNRLEYSICLTSFLPLSHLYNHENILKFADSLDYSVMS